MIPEIIIMLATAQKDGVPGEVVVGIIGAIFTGLGVLYGKMREKQAQSNEVTLKDQPIGVVKHQPAVTWNDHVNLLRRVDGHDDDIRDLRKESAAEFRALLEAANSRESRIMDKLDKVAGVIHNRIDKLIKASGGGDHD